jgi:hypothetical protein
MKKLIPVIFLSFLFHTCLSQTKVGFEEWKIEKIVRTEFVGPDQIEPNCLKNSLSIAIQNDSLFYRENSEGCLGFLSFCDTIKLYPKQFDVKKSAPDVNYAEMVVSDTSNYVNTILLNMISKNSSFAIDAKLSGYHTNCKISYGDEYLKIFYFNSKMILFFESYFIICSKPS